MSEECSIESKLVVEQRLRGVLRTPEVAILWQGRQCSLNMDGPGYSEQKQTERNAKETKLKVVNPKVLYTQLRLRKPHMSGHVWPIFIQQVTGQDPQRRAKTVVVVLVNLSLYILPYRKS